MRMETSRLEHASRFKDLKRGGSLAFSIGATVPIKSFQIQLTARALKLGPD
jgi:hypothetical protein